MTLECNPSLLQKGKLSHFVSRILSNYRKDEISLIATGPLTNIARVILEDPGNIDLLSRICIMGGAFGPASKIYGNITQFAEFNLYCDQKAAQIVLEYPLDKAVRLNVVGLDVTDKYLIIDGRFVSRLYDPQYNRGKNTVVDYSSKVSIIAKSLLEYPLAKFGKFNLPDIFAVAMLERPDLFKSKRGKINIVQDGHLRGHSIFVEENSSSNFEKRRKIFVASKILDRKRFHKYVFSRLCDGRGL
jgi:pyrimidine-specific ribonucleoside hydrolase